MRNKRKNRKKPYKRIRQKIENEIDSLYEMANHLCELSMEREVLSCDSGYYGIPFFWEEEAFYTQKVMIAYMNVLLNKVGEPMLDIDIDIPDTESDDEEWFALNSSISESFYKFIKALQRYGWEYNDFSTEELDIAGTEYMNIVSDYRPNEQKFLQSLIDFLNDERADTSTYIILYIGKNRKLGAFLSYADKHDLKGSKIYRYVCQLADAVSLPISQTFTESLKSDVVDNSYMCAWSVGWSEGWNCTIDDSTIKPLSIVIAYYLDKILDKVATIMPYMKEGIKNGI